MRHAAAFALICLLLPGCNKSKPNKALSLDDSKSMNLSNLARMGHPTVLPKPGSASPTDDPVEVPADGKSGGKKDSTGGRGGAGKGRVKTWKRSALVPNTSKLMIGDKEHLPLQGMQAHVQVDGFRARVALDCYFYNDRERQFEGTFKLRLPTGASPYFFAFGQTTLVKGADPKQPQYLDDHRPTPRGADPAQLMRARQQSWTEPKEARMVPRVKAAQAYHDTVRRRVDPALMEWSGAGVFSARVFPLQAKKLHRVVIAYDVDLQPVGHDLQYRFDIPRAKVHSVIDVELATFSGVTATVTPRGKVYPGKGHRFYRFVNPRQASITVRYRRPGPLLLTGVDPASGPYFAAAFTPRLPAASGAAVAQKAVFLVDTSLSSNPDRFNVYLKLLRQILDRNRDQLSSFAVLFFNIETRWWRPRFVANTPANVEALLAYANTLALEGATDLRAALQQGASPAGLATTKQDRWDLFLLSDGAATWGESDRNAMAATLDGSAARALFAYTTGMAGTDRRTLALLARQRGGAVFSVAGEAELGAAARAHRQRPWHLHGLTLQGGTDLMLAGRPAAIYPGQQLRLVGRGKVSGGVKVVLSLRQGGKQRQVTTHITRGRVSQLTPRTYGQVAVEQLEELSRATEDYSTAYACHFRVPGQTSSLLMLDSEADYKRYNIKPDEHAFVIKSKPAAVLVADVIRRLGHALADPRAAFMAWLQRMTRLPGVKLTVPTSLKTVLEQLPAQAFAVQVPRLKTTDPVWSSVSPVVRRQLAARKLDYLELTREAARRGQQLGPADALRALSSLVEHSPGDTVLARDVGYSAVAMGLQPQAYHLFRRVAHTRPYEPQTYRALANLLAEMGKGDLALAYYEVGLAGQWSSRFGEFRKIMALDYLRFLRRVAGTDRTSVPAYATSRLATLIREFDYAGLDLLVVITWNTDNSDVDLHLLEPGGEECYYQNRQTKIGGRLTTDVTQGYGPEMYTLARARPGTYRIRAKYFAQVRNRASARTKVHATIYRGWGTKQEQRTHKVVTLTEGKQMHDIAAVTVK